MAMGDEAPSGMAAKGYNSFLPSGQHFQENALKSQNTLGVRDRDLFTVKEAMWKRKQEAFNLCQSSVCFAN